MENKQKRHKVEERLQLTEQEREQIADKSDHKCVWCGKQVYFSYGATIDHYIPLKKGGTNDHTNLVLMCEDCNQKKGSKIIPCNVAARHLKSPFREELGQYFEDYLVNYDFISRGNLMGCDVYEMCLIPQEVAMMTRKADKRGKPNKALFSIYNKPSKTVLNRAYPDDEDRLVEYYSKYLKRNEALFSEEAARQNIQFWMRFGVIYYVEQPDGISMMATVLVNKHYFISINLFPYYSTPKSHSLAKGIVNCITDNILFENDLAYIPISVNMLVTDKLAKRIITTSCVEVIDNRILCGFFNCYNEKRETDELTVDDYAHLYEFLSRFRDIEDKVQLYLYENNAFDYSWMADEILERGEALEYISPIQVDKEDGQ